jgi:type IV secretory pathway VirB10-like protein
MISVMRWTGIGLAGALALAGAVAFALLETRVRDAANAPPPSVSAAKPAPALTPGATDDVAAPAAPAPPAPQPPVAKPAPVAEARASDAPRAASSDLLALEDQALRRIDIGPILASEGMDARELAARQGGEDVMRHMAGDELLTRAFMRDLFSTTVYPYGYPQDHAQSEARTVAAKIVAGLSPEDRASTLQRALAGSADVPTPFFYPPESGPAFDGHFRDEPAQGAARN